MFDRVKFFPIKNRLKLNNLTNLIGNNLLKYKISNDFEIMDISSLDSFRRRSILFVDGYVDLTKSIDEDICIITNNKNNLSINYQNIFLVNDIGDSYNIIINKIFLHDDSIHYNDEFIFLNGSYISKFSKIDDSVKIGKNCIIGRGVQIKKNTIIKNNVSIKNSIIEDNVIICDNSTIGSTGFGFDFSKRGTSNLSPQIGIVQINSNSHIGSNCCIDRGKIDLTYIGKNCMIDNQVHIAHNVILSDNACIAAQSGISGSVKIGKNVTIGGQVGLAGHIKIGDNVIIAAKSGVTKNIDDNSTVAGFPAIDIKLWKKKIIKDRKNGY